MSRFFAIFSIACMIIKYDNRRINNMIVIYAEKSSLDAYERTKTKRSCIARNKCPVRPDRSVTVYTTGVSAQLSKAPSGTTITTIREKLYTNSRYCKML